MTDFLQHGWLKFPRDAGLSNWLKAAIPAAHTAVTDPVNAHWLRCEGTWFAGVNVLPNDPTGAVANSGPLRGQAVDVIHGMMGHEIGWDRAQISVIYPGYPRPKDGESAAAFRFRRDRDAAHVDGLHAVGTDRRRMLCEPHAFVLGLPLTKTDEGASPMVVWEGSHQLMRAAFRAVLERYPVETWGEVDLSEAYHAARREVFESCRRVVVHGRPGEAYLVHRLALHGVSPWKSGAVAPPEGRMIAYFRPELSGSIEGWLALP